MDAFNEIMGSEDETKVIKKGKKKDLANPLVQRSKNRGRVKEEEHSSSEDSEDDFRLSYKSKRTEGREGPKDMGATSTIQFETEKDRDAQAVFERSLQVNKETRGKEDDKVYRGMSNYSHFFEKKDTAQGNAASGGVRKGPMRAPDNLRATVRWDYQPDLCKDFKETGFCGFGDSCKFLHDRTDYKLGWQLEVEATKGGDDSDENWEIPSDDEHLPFKCFICRESFVDPIVTKCKHYFCEKCALDHFKKSRRCFVCAQDTGGIFSPAAEIRTKLQNGNLDDSD
ncbi:E3 ubiquitin-protein ligase RNF113A-like isoform X2 [Eriocheir sinensis]|uniref:E3 ubiquitin-protein ligase RNF113A-like isoform X2 n=1 Tax=Eriocheir sinensis TaxID=95602 RepID=UPI0021C8553C|nr:E3 ubiquitin-protein ligase RNF113A-like isoform X2 [Eriocheir sinensis]